MIPSDTSKIQDYKEVVKGLNKSLGHRGKS